MKYSYFIVKKDTILVMDDASIHKIDIVQNKFKELQKKDKYDSSRLTR